jgi:ATP-dependent DNA helicase RecG
LLATHLYKHSQNCQDYKYVKDFGEGVDRMCREMEAQGLPKPEYRQDAFILKAIVKNSGFGSKNLGIGDKNLGCAPATATNLIKRMKTLNIVEPVVGAGKGKYVLRRAK